MSYEQSVNLDELYATLGSVQQTRDQLVDATSTFEKKLVNQRAEGTKDGLFLYLDEQSETLKKIAQDSVDSLDEIEKWIKQEIARLEEAERIRQQILRSR